MEFVDGHLVNPPEDVRHMRTIVHSDRFSDNMTSRLAPELIINADNFDQAQRALRLIVAAYTVSHMARIDGTIEFAVPDDPADYPNSMAFELDFQMRQGIAIDGIFQTARMAAAASKRKVLQHALARYYVGFQVAGTHWMDTHPYYGEKIAVKRDPMEYIAIAQSIIAFYSVLEELNVEIKASQQNPSRLPDGSWNPNVLGPLRANLASIGVDPDDTIVWVLRGSPSRIERKHRTPDGVKASWSRGAVRDREISICDAILYASLLRSRVSAHRTSSRTQSLTKANLISVQMLARKILMKVLGHPLAK